MHYVDDAERPEQMSGLTSGTLPVWHVGGGTCLGMLTQHRTSNREREGGKNRGKYIKSQLEQWHKRETRLIYFRERDKGWSQQFDVTEVMTGDKGRAFCFVGHRLQMAVQCQLITVHAMTTPIGFPSRHRCSGRAGFYCSIDVHLSVFSDVFTDIWIGAVSLCWIAAQWQGRFCSPSWWLDLHNNTITIVFEEGIGWWYPIL